MTTEAELGQAIVKYWRDRATLTKGQWNDFARVTLAYLVPRYLSHYATLKRYFPSSTWDEMKLELVVDFFDAKIFSRALAEDYQVSELRTGRSLVSHYKNYLLDRIDKYKRIREDPIPVGGDDDQGYDSPEVLKHSTDTGSSTTATGNSETTPEGSLSADELETETELKEAAIQFLDRNEDWVTICLACSYCPEKGVPMYRLSELHGMTSYASKAKRLGLTKPHGGYTEKDPWSGTLLGQWFSSIGVPIDSHLGPKSLLAVTKGPLKILCREAFKRMKGIGPCQP